MKQQTIKNLLQIIPIQIIISFFLLHSTIAKTIYLGNYPKDREPGWSDECQGITHDKSFWYVTQKNRLWKFPVSFDLNKQVPASIKRVGIPSFLKNKKYDHFGDLAYYNGYLFIPLEHEHYKLPPKIVVFKAHDLSFVSEANLDASRGGSHAMSCAINPKNGLLYVAQFRHGHASSIRVLIYRQRITNGRLKLQYIRKMAFFREDGQTPLYPRSIQGLSFSRTSGLLYLVSDIGTKGGIFVFDPTNGRKLKRIKVDYDPEICFFRCWRREELEGLTIWDLDNGRAPNIKGQVHLIMIDNVGTGDDDLYFKHFLVPGEKHLSGIEDCLPINHKKLKVRKRGSYWELVDNRRIINQTKTKSEAERAKQIIEHYKIDRQCFNGRPHPSMEYYLVNGRSPEGPMAEEDCVRFNPSLIEMKWVKGRWKIVEGDHWILDFGNEGLECLSALHIIKKYGFKHICFTKRPNPSMVYFRK